MDGRGSAVRGPIVPMQEAGRGVRRGQGMEQEVRSMVSRLYRWSAWSVRMQLDCLSRAWFLFFWICFLAYASWTAVGGPDEAKQGRTRAEVAMAR